MLKNYDQRLHETFRSNTKFLLCSVLITRPMYYSLVFDPGLVMFDARTDTQDLN